MQQIKNMNTYSVIHTLKLTSLLLALFLSACVTTTNSTQPQLDADKAEASHVAAGLAYLRNGDKEPAERHFLKALEYNKNSAGANNGLAIVYQMEEQWELAENHFKKALSSDADFSQARNNYGSFLYARERYQDAKEQLLIVSRDTQYEKRHAVLLNLGLVYLKLGEVDKAKTVLRQAVNIYYRLPAAHLELANIYYAERDFPKAKQYYDQFVKMSRQTPRSLWLGIRIARAFGNYDKLSSYEMALKNLYPYSQEYLEYKESIERNK